MIESENIPIFRTACSLETSKVSIFLLSSVTVEERVSTNDSLVPSCCCRFWICPSISERTPCMYNILLTVLCGSSSAWICLYKLENAKGHYIQNIDSRLDWTIWTGVSAKNESNIHKLLIVVSKSNRYGTCNFQGQKSACLLCQHLIALKTAGT